MADHLAAHFKSKGSYLVSDSVYQRFVKGNRKLGRPQGGNSYLFVAGGEAIDKVLEAAKKGDGYDFTVVEQKLSLPPGTYAAAGGLWRIDVNVMTNCARFPTKDDPGANAEFVAGGFTKGGIPEILVINAPARFAKQLAKPASAHPKKGSEEAKTERNKKKGRAQQ